VKVKELEKWLAAIGVGFPVVSHLANEPMSKIRNYQRVNYQILESWLAKNGKKAKVGTREKINQIVTREASLTPAEIEKMDQEGLFERDEYVLSSVEQQQLATIKQQIEELDLTSAQKTTLTEVTESFYKTPSKSTRPQF
jgi:uncharacterized protein YaiL (DUF2058 family)